MRAARTALAILAAVGALGACAHNPSPKADDTIVRVDPPIAPVRRYGLEVAWWVTWDPDGALGPTLRALAEPDQRFDPEILERLRDHGLRAVRLTEPALFELTTRALPVGGIDRLWLGLASAWTPARLPAPVSANTPRPFPDLGHPVAPGALRFLWRSYLAAEWLDPVLRVDVTGQAIDPAYAKARFNPQASTLPSPVDAGPLIDDIRSTLVLRPGEVIVLIGDAPDADWSEPAAAPRAYDPDAPPPGVAITEDAPPADPIDAEDYPEPPPEPQTITTAPLPKAATPPRRTFGEMMLTTPLPGDPSRTGRLIVVVIPQIPDTVELIAPARPAE